MFLDGLSSFERMRSFRIRVGSSVPSDDAADADTETTRIGYDPVAGKFKPGLQITWVSEMSATEALSTGEWTTGRDILAAASPDMVVTYCTASKLQPGATRTKGSSQAYVDCRKLNYVARAWQIAVLPDGRYAVGPESKKGKDDRCTVYLD